MLPVPRLENNGRYLVVVKGSPPAEIAIGHGVGLMIFREPPFELEFRAVEVHHPYADVRFAWENLFNHGIVLVFRDRVGIKKKSVLEQQPSAGVRLETRPDIGPHMSRERMIRLQVNDDTRHCYSSRSILSNECALRGCELRTSCRAAGDDECQC